MNRKNRWKKSGILVITAAVLGSSFILPCGGRITGYAAGLETPLGTYTEEEMTAFQDQILEYWEIQGLIEQYNPSYLKQLEIFNGNPDGSSGLSKEQHMAMASAFRAEAEELKEEAEEKKDSLSEDAYKEYQDNIKTLRKYARNSESASKGTSSTKQELRRVRNQLTYSYQIKMREYADLAAQNRITEKSLELAELNYESAKRQMELGMYSAENLLTMEDALNSVRTAMDTSTINLTKSRQDLLMAFGWSYNANLEIYPIPEADLEKIASYDLTADTKAAVSANYDVGDLRKKDKSEFNNTADKLRQIREKEDQVRMQMEYLYKDVEQKRLSYETALDGWTVAEANKAQADRKYQLGMLSKSEYLSAEITWLTAKASKEQASMDLIGAMEAYEWAIKGLIEL